jgi:hypothetical protein
VPRLFPQFLAVGNSSTEFDENQKVPPGWRFRRVGGTEYTSGVIACGFKCFRFRHTMFMWMCWFNICIRFIDMPKNIYTWIMNCELMILKILNTFGKLCSNKLYGGMHTDRLRLVVTLFTIVNLLKVAIIQFWNFMLAQLLSMIVALVASQYNRTSVAIRMAH